MIGIDEYKRFVDFISNKAGKGASSISEFNLLSRRAQSQFVMRRNNNPATYQPGVPMPRVGWQQSNKISDDLSFLLMSSVISIQHGELRYPNNSDVKDVNGTVLPNYLHLSSLRAFYSEYEEADPVDHCFDEIPDIKTREVDIDIIDDNEIGAVLSSDILKPTNRFPKAAFFSDMIKVYPYSVQKVRLTYLREPKNPSWAYTLVNNRPVYDPGNSVDIEAPQENLNEIAMIHLSYLGINLREGELVQYTEALKQQGG